MNAIKPIFDFYCLGYIAIKVQTAQQLAIGINSVNTDNDLVLDIEKIGYVNGKLKIGEYLGQSIYMEFHPAYFELFTSKIALKEYWCGEEYGRTPRTWTAKVYDRNMASSKISYYYANADVAYDFPYLCGALIKMMKTYVKRVKSSKTKEAKTLQTANTQAKASNESYLKSLGLQSTNLQHVNTNT